MNEKFIDKLIDQNYAVLKAFEVADGDITLSDYFEDVKNHRRKK